LISLIQNGKSRTQNASADRDQLTALTPIVTYGSGDHAWMRNRL
jgi:hypothetical protein